MKLIKCDELKAKIDRGDDFKLVMVLSEFAYRFKHIPGSLNISSLEQGVEMLSPDDEIVLYCSGVTCIASVAAFQYLTDAWI